MSSVCCCDCCLQTTAATAYYQYLTACFRFRHAIRKDFMMRCRPYIIWIDGTGIQWWKFHCPDLCFMLAGRTRITSSAAQAATDLICVTLFCLVREGRICKELTSHGYHIDFSCCNCFLCLLRRVDTADCRNRNGYVLFDNRCRFNIRTVRCICGCELPASGRTQVMTTGYMNHINVRLAQFTVFYRIFQL